ncbi:MAG: glycosyltransferase family 4 protein [Pseudomonadota bacterium]
MPKLLTGGAENAALELVRALEGDRMHFVAAAVLAGDDGLGAALARAGAEVTGPLAGCRYDLVAPLRLRRAIRDSNADVVLMVGALRNAMFHLAAASAMGRLSVARLCWCHSRPGGQAGRFVRPLRLCRALGVIDAVICVSRHQRAELERMGLRRRHTMVIRNGVNLNPFSSGAAAPLVLPEGKRVIVQVANVTPDKDHATLIEAAGLLLRRRDDFHLLLVGRGTDSPAMAAAVDRAGIGACCTLAGLRHDVPAILAAADVFVLSSAGEVAPIALMEAMAASLPVVVSDIPAVADIVTDGKEGLKFPIGDAQALAGAIDRILSDDGAARRMAAAARARAETFCIAETARRFERVLRAAGLAAEEK